MKSKQDEVSFVLAKKAIAAASTPLILLQAAVFPSERSGAILGGLLICPPTVKKQPRPFTLDSKGE